MLTLPEIFSAPKRVSGKFAWSATGPYQEGFEVPLEIFESATMAGLRLRVEATATQPERDFTVQLEYFPGSSRRYGQIDRIDWRPAHAHSNHKKGPIELQGILITTCHHHCFELNYFPAEDRMLRNNLPIAVLLEPIDNSMELLQFAAKYYNIEDLHVPQRPPRQGRLF